MEEMHRRLLGTWRSHKARTLANFHRYHTLEIRKKRALGRLFGKMTVKYTPQYVWNSLLGVRERYDVVATDKGGNLWGDTGTIVIRVRCDNTRRVLAQALGTDMCGSWEPSLWHIHFREIRGREYYWIATGAFCEWFVRMDQQPRPAR